MTSWEINSEKNFEMNLHFDFVAFLPFNWCSLVFPCDVTVMFMIHSTVVVIPKFYTLTDILVTFSGGIDDLGTSK